MYDIIPVTTVPLSSEFYSSQYNDIRRCKLLLLSSILTKYSEFKSKPYLEQTNIIKRIEISCLNSTIDKANVENITTSWEVELFCDLYNSFCYKVTANLDKDGLVSNPNFALITISGGISLKDISKMTSQEMYPEKYKDINERINMSKLVVQTIKTSALYKCPLCKENKCSIENRYNRSLDEGAGLTLNCLNCQHQWNA